VLRPILVGKDTKMPDYVVLIATLGGIAVVGVNGFVIGPLVAGWSADLVGFRGAFALSAIPVVVAAILVGSIRETMPSLPRTSEAAGL